VTAGVIDVLEVIQIEKEQRARVAGLQQTGFQLAQQTAPIGQAGERILVGPARQPGARLFFIRHIPDDPEGAHELGARHLNLAENAQPAHRSVRLHAGQLLIDRLPRRRRFLNRLQHESIEQLLPPRVIGVASAKTADTAGVVGPDERGPLCIEFPRAELRQSRNLLEGGLPTHQFGVLCFEPIAIQASRKHLTYKLGRGDQEFVGCARRGSIERRPSLEDY
jgi:hypothetical protein